jgi:hypothetical protein
MAKPHIVAESDKLSETDYPTNTLEKAANPVPQVDQDQLDAEEEEFRAMRRDLPGVKGASASGIVAMSVGKAPAKNEFFRLLAVAVRQPHGHDAHGDDRSSTPAPRKSA